MTLTDHSEVVLGVLRRNAAANPGPHPIRCAAGCIAMLVCGALARRACEQERLWLSTRRGLQMPHARGMHAS